MFKSILRVGYELTKLPVDIVVDAATLGGVTTDTESRIARRLKNIDEEITDAISDKD